MALNYLVNDVSIQANPLLDLDFIDELHHQRIRVIHARIIALNNEEQNLEAIEGVVTQGTVTVDGSSAIRRTVSLSMVCKELNIHEFYWGLKTKVEVWAGIENKINPKYPDIIWFKQGVFVLTSFSTTQGMGQYTISLQGKDKMTLLNGELGGTVTSLSWDFGTVSVVSTSGVTKKEKLLLKDIIMDAVHTFAVMPFWKIRVNDLDDLGLELLEYRGKDPMYLIINSNTGKYNTTLNGETIYYLDQAHTQPIKIEDLTEKQYNPLFDLEQQGYVQSQLLTVYDTYGVPYTIARLTYGMTAGYRLTDLTYAGDLILNVGDTITSLLDKIVNMLGEYEYYFDLDGNFIFERKQIYLKTHWDSLKTNDNNEKWAEPNAYSSAITYSFEDAELITSYTNSPKFDSIRNDYSIWGTRKGVSGKEVPVHLRYAIDEKPFDYVSYDKIKYTTRTEEENKAFEETISYMTVSEDEKSRIAAYNATTVTYSAEYEELLNLMDHRTNYNGLPLEWWDINDWARVWVIVNDGDETKIPPDTMIHYSKSYCDIRGADYFGDPRGLASTVRHWHLICTDADYNITEIGHNGGCGHPYTWWLDKMAREGGHCYVYDPVFPDDMEALVQAKVEEAHLALANIVNLYNRLYTTLYTELDWREIIYQMAEDYKKHHHEEDFYLTVGQNNPYSYPNGITGYEPYYTDMDGFWRELYDPFYEGHYELVGMTPTKYKKAVKQWYDTVLTGAKADFPYFYQAHQYVQCTANDTFHRDRQYYTKSTDSIGVEVYTAVRVTISEYNTNFSNYYYEPYFSSETELKEAIQNCLIREPYDDAVYWFATIGNSRYPGYMYAPNDDATWIQPYNVSVAMLRADYATYLSTGVIPLNYMKMINTYAIPCFKSLPLQTYYIYYYLDDDGREQKVSGTKIDRDDYYNYPMKYWRYTGEYRQCVVGEEYDPDEDYYVKGTALRTEEETYTLTKQVTESRFNLDPTRYWVLVNDHVRVDCYTIDIPDNIGEAYFVTTDKDFIEKLDVLSCCTKIHNTNTLTGYIQYSGKEYRAEQFSSMILQAVHNGDGIWAVYCECVPIVHPIAYDPTIAYYVADNDAYGEDHWATYVYTDPDKLNFWFDFMDQGGYLQKYSNHAIGNRPKAVNDNNVKSIYFRETPTVIFTEEPVPEIPPKQGYTYFQIQSNLLSLFSISGQGKSAKTVLDQYIYQYAQAAEEISFNTLPYYNLQPNKRIFLSCAESGISGEYIMTRFSVPLGPQTSMTITGVKAVDALY